MKTKNNVKINVNMFDDTKLKIIDTKPERDLIHYIWFRMVALAGKVDRDGELYLSKNIPFTPETFAIEFNRGTYQINLALDILIELEMIEIVDDNVYKVKNFTKHQGSRKKVQSTKKVKEENTEKTNEQENIKEEKNTEPAESIEDNSNSIDSKYSKKDIIISKSNSITDKDESFIHLRLDKDSNTKESDIITGSTNNIARGSKRQDDNKTTDFSKNKDKSLMINEGNINIDLEKNNDKDLKTKEGDIPSDSAENKRKKSVKKHPKKTKKNSAKRKCIDINESEGEEELINLYDGEISIKDGTVISTWNFEN